MAQTEGEKEIVLGNKQLISLFFVVVALCGVFFALGYMMGRPANKQLLATATDAAPATPAPTAATAPAAPTDSQDSQAPGDSETAPQSPPAPTPVPTPSPTETQPAQDAPAAAPAPVAAKPIAPEPGATYLQVTALLRPDADKLVKALREQTLPALVAESSKPDLFRVLVGPYHSTADVADAKAKLKALGFANAFVQKQ